MTDKSINRPTIDILHLKLQTYNNKRPTGKSITILQVWWGLVNMRKDVSNVREEDITVMLPHLKKIYLIPEKPYSLSILQTLHQVVTLLNKYTQWSQISWELFDSRVLIDLIMHSWMWSKINQVPSISSVSICLEVVTGMLRFAWPLVDIHLEF